MRIPLSTLSLGPAPAVGRFLAGAALAVAGAFAQAAVLPFDAQGFDAALAKGQPVVVDFSAGWCPTCAAQKPHVDALMRDPKRQGLTLFVADFDKEAALKQRLHVTMQSTFVVFRQGKEVARSTGQTAPQDIAAVFDKAL